MENVKFEKMPHFDFVKYAMRFNGIDEETLIKCWNHAKLNCPDNVNFAIRQINGFTEWYAPIVPLPIGKEVK